ncbi:MAG TPA: hypothetical protein VF131_01710 [Blastocatellia bacterium]|nr:hypothetical protein [Blastocatellia bacterium]
MEFLSFTRVKAFRQWLSGLLRRNLLRVIVIAIFIVVTGAVTVVAKSGGGGSRTRLQFLTCRSVSRPLSLPLAPMIAAHRGQLYVLPRLTTDSGLSKLILREQFFLPWLAAIFTLGLCLMLSFAWLKNKSNTPFKPELNSTGPRHPIVVDFNSQESGLITISKLSVRNKHRAGEYLSDAPQPQVRAVIKLNYTPLNHLEFDVKEDVEPIGFRIIDTEGNGAAQSTNPTGSLASEVILPVTPGKYVELCLAPEAILDYLQKPKLQHEITCNISLTVSGDGDRAPGQGTGQTSPDGFRFTDAVTDHLPLEDEKPVFAGKTNFVTRMLSGALRALRKEKIALPHTASCDVKFQLHIISERPTPPELSVLAVSRQVHFDPGQKIKVAHFQFTSRARHRCAETFFSEDYKIRATKNGRPLPDTTIQLSPPNILLKKGESVDVWATLDCDDQNVGEPEAEIDHYGFTVTDHEGKELAHGPYEFTLLRNPERTNLYLRVKFMDIEREIFWDCEGQIVQRFIKSEYAAIEDRISQDSQLDLGAEEPLSLRISRPAIGSPKSPLRSSQKTTARPDTVLEITIGNTAKEGEDGHVSMKVKAAFKPDLQFADRITYRSGSAGEVSFLFEHLNDGQVDQGDESSLIEVHDGEAPATLATNIEYSSIEYVKDGGIPHTNCHIELQLDLQITPPGEQPIDRPLQLKIPVHLVQLLGDRFLCIDFGTSAIAVAIGDKGGDGIEMVDLQKIIAYKDGHGYGVYDPDNIERDTCFLPSWVICDADQRLKKIESQGEGSERLSDRNTASLRPGDASFVGLPAAELDLERNINRVVFGLKSWLGNSSYYVPLGEEITYEENGQEVVDDEVPLDDLMVSAFAALAETYLRQQPGLMPHQVVVCYPNTFTKQHQLRLKRIVSRALMKPLDLVSEDHIKMISESDAVAYFYYESQEHDPGGKDFERLLVYDFGAGTTDISIISFKWEKKVQKNWTIESRIGVPLAGNHFDELIARLIHDLLDKGNILDDRFEYKYKIAIDEPRPSSFITEQAPVEKGDPAYAKAMLNLWKAIRIAKHNWKKGDPLKVKVGYWAVETEPFIIRLKQSIDYEKVKQEDEGMFAEQPHSPRPYLWVDSARVQWLSIPYEVIKEDDRIKAFMEFITQTIIEEAQAFAGVGPDKKITTVIVSGRGSQLPDLEDGVIETVSRLSGKVDKSNLSEMRGGKINLKQAVAHGAIAWQVMEDFLKDGVIDEFNLPLAIITRPGRKLIPRDEWEEIEMVRQKGFKIIELMSKSPNLSWKEDRLHPYRRYLYVIPPGAPYQTERYVNKKDWILSVRAELEADKLKIRFIDSSRQERKASQETIRANRVIGRSPWPFGKGPLHPEGPPED